MDSLAFSFGGDGFLDAMISLLAYSVFVLLDPWIITVGVLASQVCRSAVHSSGLSTCSIYLILMKVGYA